ncbi:hypothetical protein PILCRDRAFT_742236 [Piloderma croceum F 1598]|uniref:Uncharacterized protein n=1 Tax=Piloderma croceum (strain F 1598) TaxID=765440 RepID=A0A0C3B4X3_PILCF|nr:hypothetical protein PILCRDRAFT_742236 [Piloderma croceum F 1598]
MYRTANKYRRGQFDENMGLGYTIHNVLLRRFGLDDIELIRKVSMPSGNNNGEESDSTPPVATKRQRTQVGRIPKGEDFWGKADGFFAQLVTQYGRTLTSTRWAECVNDMIRCDDAQFSPQAEHASSSQQVTAQGALLASALSGF